MNIIRTTEKDQKLETEIDLKRAALALSLLLAATLNAQRPADPSTSRPLTSPVVNINTATLEQLCYLPGVGKVMAARIVAGRPYRVQGSLVYVKGIKDARLRVMFHYITVSGPTTAAAKIHAAGAK